MAKSTISNGQSGLSVRNALNAMFTDLYGGTVKHVVGNWYCPLEGITQTGGAIGANTIRLLPFVISQTVTISDLGAVITTGSAGGNCQLAIYAARSATDYLPGVLVGSTGNISTTSTGNVSADITGADIVLTPGLYYLAVNSDNGVVVFTQITNTSLALTRYVGSATIGNVLQSGGGTRQCWSFTQTFGTWPDLTAQTIGVSNNNCAIVYKVSAVS